METINFNSHPHEEDDAVAYFEWDVPKDFNSHPHEEDDVHGRKGESTIQTFQLTSSRGG